MLQKIKKKIFSISVPPCEKKDEYYFSIGRLYGISGIILLICASIFVLASIVFGYRELTHENIYYFIKDFDTVITSDSYNAITVDYGIGDNRSYYCYRGGIVAAEKYAISVYSATGRETAVLPNEYARPVVCCSSKYMLVYDSDGTGFSICNSFAFLYSENIGNRIYSADINDMGEALIHAEASGYGSVLYLYSGDFKRAAAYCFNEYITCSDLSDDGKRILVSTASIKDGAYVSNFEIYLRGEDQAFMTYDVYGEISLECGQLASDEYYLITDHGVRIFDIKGNIVKEYFISDDDNFIDFYKSENGIAISVQSDDKYCLTYIPHRGDILTLKLNSKPLSLSCVEDSAYVLYDGAVAKYDLVAGTYKLIDCAPGGVKLLTTQSGRILLCYSARAVCVDF